MSVEVIMTGRLGNNLFQYAIGRIIAEHHRLELTCVPPKHPVFAFMGRELDIGSSASLDGLQDCFPNAPLHIPGRRLEIPVENFDMTTDDSWNSHTIDLYGLLANPTPRKIRLLGNFQRYEYFEPFQSSIRNWFDFRSPSCPYELRPQDVVLNIRRGLDFWLHDATLSMSYYHQALSRLHDVGKVYVCGVGLDSQVRLSLAKYSPVYYDATPAEHFGFMKRFHRIILSNSTFSWWAAFLSDASEILAPRSTLGCQLGLSGVGEIDLNMNESFEGHEMFVVGTSPTYRLRRSRNLGPGMVLIFQPRTLFIDPTTSQPIASSVRQRIHKRMLAYDGMPVHPDIGFYGDSINREWKQYALPDDNEAERGACPFRTLP